MQINNSSVKGGLWKEIIINGPCLFNKYSQISSLNKSCSFFVYTCVGKYLWSARGCVNVRAHVCRHTTYSLDMTSVIYVGIRKVTVPKANWLGISLRMTEEFQSLKFAFYLTLPLFRVIGDIKWWIWLPLLLKPIYVITLNPGSSFPWFNGRKYFTCKPKASFSIIGLQRWRI
jgi:hypothetical protein